MKLCSLADHLPPAVSQVLTSHEPVPRVGTPDLDHSFTPNKCLIYADKTDQNY